ncbi:hypothetical protein [Mammaliicoccus sciuri]|uniref:hypothetical protein n=1 Tax=Mammaliicoccus sciuri TaxID=1296 RepID=UPI003F560ECF
MEILKTNSEVITIVGTIITLISILIYIIPKLKEIITNVNSYEDKKTLSDYIRIYGIIIWTLFLSIFIYIVTFIIFVPDEKEFIKLFNAISTFIPIFISMFIGIVILILNHKYSAKIYIYNKLRTEQYELYINKYDDKIKKHENLNMISGIDKPAHEFMNLIEEFKKAPFKTPKIVIVYNCLSILFILLWGISIIPSWEVYEKLDIFTRIIFIITMFIPIFMVAYRLVSLQNGKLKLSEYEIKKHIKRYKRQHRKNNQTRTSLRTITIFNYEITFNKLEKGRQTDEK